MADLKNLKIADGLKELLLEYGFTKQRIQKIQPENLAAILGIEEYVAKIIHNAALQKDKNL
ncbi:MAG TPA: hypothetical protein VH415_10795 [Nitrososphaeraceae archaeon]